MTINTKSEALQLHFLFTKQSYKSIHQCVYNNHQNAFILMPFFMHPLIFICGQYSEYIKMYSSLNTVTYPIQ